MHRAEVYDRNCPTQAKRGLEWGTQPRLYGDGGSGSGRMQ
jgi:hypothetical protein